VGWKSGVKWHRLLSLPGQGRRDSSLTRFARAGPYVPGRRRNRYVDLSSAAGMGGRAGPELRRGANSKPWPSFSGPCKGRVAVKYFHVPGSLILRRMHRHSAARDSVHCRQIHPRTLAWSEATGLPSFDPQGSTPQAYPNRSRCDARGVAVSARQPPRSIERRSRRPTQHPRQ